MKFLLRLTVSVLAFGLITPAAQAEEDLFNETATTQIETPEVVLAAPSYEVKATISKGMTSIKVTTNVPNATLTAIASKSGVKAKLTLRFKTNANGIATVSTKANLKGYLLTIYNGSNKVISKKL